MHQFNSHNNSTNQLHQLSQSNHEYLQYDTDTSCNNINIDTNITNNTTNDIDLELSQINEPSYNTHSHTIVQHAINAITAVLYALLLTNHISTARLSNSVNITSGTIIKLIDPSTNAVYNDKFSIKVNTMLMELKLLLGISDIQFESIKYNVLQRYTNKQHSPSVSDSSSTHSNNTNTTNNSYIKNNTLTAAYNTQHSTQYMNTYVPSSQVVPFTGTLSSQLRTATSYVTPQHTTQSYLHTPTIHDGTILHDTSIYNNTLKSTHSTNGLDTLYTQSQQWQPSRNIVHTVQNPYTSTRQYSTRIGNTLASSINRNYQFNSNRNTLKSTARQPKLPSHAQKANGSTYMTEAQFVSYFKNATSLVEAVKSIVRAHPTYREVSIYARARRMELRYDANGILTQGKTFVNPRDVDNCSPEQALSTSSDDTSMHTVQMQHNHTIGSLNSIAEHELDLENEQNESNEKLSPVTVTKNGIVEHTSDSKVSNTSTGTTGTTTTATTTVIDDMTAASTLTSMSPLTSRSNSSSNTSDSSYTQTTTRSIVKSASHMNLRHTPTTRYSSDMSVERRNSLSPCKRKADEMEQ